MSQDRLPFAMFGIAAVYVFSLLLALSSYGNPFPFMGRFYPGKAGEWFVLADSLVSLYLVIGVLKRQRLTVWVLIAYNLFDILNACVNLALIPAEHYAALSGGAIPADELRSSTISAAVFLVIMSAYVFGNRRHFSNTSPYLF